MSYKIKNIIDWYKGYDKLELSIKTNTKEFNINVDIRSLPHLLGLQYSNQQYTKGRKLLNDLYNKSDEEIFKSVKANNKSKLSNVKDRVHYFESFMKNLENAKLYSNMHTKTNIKSDNLFVELDNRKYLQLGIARDRADVDYLETFIVSKDDKYIKNSLIEENIISIERYENDKLIPFSFDEKKNEKLLEEYYDDKKYDPLSKDTDLDGVIDRYDADFKDSDIQENADIVKKQSTKDKIKSFKEKVKEVDISKDKQEIKQVDKGSAER